MVAMTKELNWPTVPVQLDHLTDTPPYSPTSPLPNSCSISRRGSRYVLAIVVDAEIMQPHEGHRERTDLPNWAPQRPAKNSPAMNEDTECPFDCDA